MTFLIQEDQIFSVGLSEYPWVFLNAVKIKICNKSYSTPKKYTAGFLENDRNSEFPPREPAPIFTCSRAQGSPRNPIKSGGGFSADSLHRDTPLMKFIPAKAILDNMLIITELLRGPKIVAILGSTVWMLKNGGETCAKLKHCGNREWTCSGKTCYFQFKFYANNIFFTNQVVVQLWDVTIKSRAANGWMDILLKQYKYVLHYIVTVIVIVQLTVYTLLGTNISYQKSLLSR